jgi:salicylate hydroxylase
MKVIVVGAGIGGLAAALALRGQGVEVQVVEQANELREIGAGLQISSNGLRVLRDLGLEQALADVAVAARSIVFRDLLSDRVLVEQPLGRAAAARYGAPFFQVHRADLLGLLAEALPARCLRLGSEVLDVHQDAAGASATLAGGEELVADAVVGADGIHSRVQQAVVGRQTPRFSGILGWRALLAREQAAELGLGPTCDCWLGPGRSVVTYWVRRGELLNVIGFVPAREVRRESWTASGDVDEMRASFAGAGPLVQRMMSLVSSAFITGVYYHHPLERWSDGRVTLLGDAAHATQPYLAQGACQSLEDAAVLAHLLGRNGPRGVPYAFAQYEQRRRPRTTKVQAVARAAERFWHERDPVQIRARDGRFRGLARLDPLAETVWGWLYRHDPIAALEHPAEEAQGLATAPAALRMRRPEAQRAADVWRAAFSADDHAGGWRGLRAGYERFTRRHCTRSPEALVEPVCAGGVPALWVGPSRADRPTVLHLHGGGFMLGSARGSLGLAERIGRALDARVLTIDYRLAPEHAYPAALQDVLSAYCWLLERGIPGSDVVLSGESAGGGLAVAAVLAARRRSLPSPAAVYAASPMADLTLSGRSVDASRGQDPVVDRDMLTEFASCYLQGQDPRDPLASPIHGDFEAFPPLLVHAAAREALTDDATRLVHAARTAGVAAELRLFEDTVHAFPMLAFLPEAEEALVDLARFVALRM